MIATLLLLTGLASAQEAPEPEPRRFDGHRQYDLVYASGYDLRTFSVAGPTLNRMTQDVYLYGIAPHLGKTADGILGTAWSAFFTYTTMLWPHEFGHWSRANQVDSQFIFHNAMPILPRTTVQMPASATTADSALLSVGGFEVNSLVARQTQLDFYRRDGAWSDDLAHGLLNEMFFPLYAGLFPARAKLPITWEQTRGDPVHFVLPVYERHTNRPAVMANGEVDPELVRLYRESVLLSVGWALLDPGMAQQGLAFFDSGFASRDAWTAIRTDHFRWTWGTQFNPSPLGYELYLSNYLGIEDRTFEVAVKVGRPFKNRGVRIHVPDLYDTDHLRLGAEAELWDQDVHGFGVLFAGEGEVRLKNGLGLIGWLGYKDEGYVLGRPVGRTAFGAVGMSYRFEHGPERSDR